MLCAKWMEEQMIIWFVRGILARESSGELQQQFHNEIHQFEYNSEAFASLRWII